MKLPFDAACQAAATDGEFRIAARFWNASLRFVCGDEAHLVEIRDGQPLAVANDPGAPVSAAISAPADTWEKMLVPVPAPFYHDLVAAARYHNVQFDATADDASTAYYPAIRRFIELLREAKVRNAAT